MNQTALWGPPTLAAWDKLKHLYDELESELGREGRLEEGEVAVARNGQFLRDLLDALPAAIYTTDAAGRITFYNQAAVAFSGRRPTLGSDEWCVSWRLYWPDGTPLPHDQCPMAIALKEGRPVRGAEAVAERPDGTRVPFIPYPTPLRDRSGAVIGAVNMLVDITERKQAEERLSLLAHEVNHRANNLLTLVQAMVRLTEADTAQAFKNKVERRVRALAQAHTLLAKSGAERAELRPVIEKEFAPYVDLQQPERVRLIGPRVVLGPAVMQCLAVVLHELVTNAAKYGAPSVSSGEVKIEWSDAAGGLGLHWIESGGPEIIPPTRHGFGMTVIERMVRQLGGEVHIEWRPAGVSCTVAIPASTAMNRAS